MNIHFAIVKINIKAIKFDDMTVTFHPTNHVPNHNQNREKTT